MSEACYICGSTRFVDNHHYDCKEGEISPDTVPLCRRCHRTYHDWGIEAFSPDTTLKALEVENTKRALLGKSPLTLTDIQHSYYWLKKWGFTRTKSVKPLPRGKSEGQQLPLRLPL